MEIASTVVNGFDEFIKRRQADSQTILPAQQRLLNKGASAQLGIALLSHRIRPILLLCTTLLLTVGCAGIESDWKKARSIDTLVGYSNFLEQYPEGEFSDKALTRIEVIRWRKAQTLDTREAYENFLEHYPDGVFSIQALNRIEILDWKYTQYRDTEKVYADYVNRYPKGIFSNDARERIETLDWEKAQRSDNSDSYARFLERYPDGRYSSQAREREEDRQWDDAKSADNIEEYEAFLKHYPKGKYLGKATERLTALRKLKKIKSELKTMLKKWEAKAPKSIKKDIDILRSGDAVAKGYAALRLGGKGTKAKGAIGALIETMTHFGENLEIRLPSTGRVKYAEYFGMTASTSTSSLAAQALSEIGEDAVEPLVLELQNGSFSWFEKLAVRTLGDIGDARAVDPIVAALNDDDWGLRRAAAVALGKLKDSHAVEPLISALEDSDFYLHAAASALGELKDPRAVGPLVTALDESNPDDTREAAAKALGKICDQRAVEPLIEALMLRKKASITNDHVRIAAADALGELRDLRAIEPLFATLKYGDFFLRRSAKGALVKFGKIAADQFIAILKSKRPTSFEIETVGQALAETNDPRAIKPLVALLKNSEQGTHEAVEYALRKITGQNFGKEYKKWKSWLDGR